MSNVNPPNTNQRFHGAYILPWKTHNENISKIFSVLDGVKTQGRKINQEVDKGYEGWSRGVVI